MFSKCQQFFVLVCLDKIVDLFSKLKTNFQWEKTFGRNSLNSIIICYPLCLLNFIYSWHLYALVIEALMRLCNGLNWTGKYSECCCLYGSSASLMICIWLDGIPCARDPGSGNQLSNQITHSMLWQMSTFGTIQILMMLEVI